MYAPTGVGVLFGKKALLEKQNPRILGGGMTNTFDENYAFDLIS